MIASKVVALLGLLVSPCEDDNDDDDNSVQLFDKIYHLVEVVRRSL